jgi:hypothetical protein
MQNKLTASVAVLSISVMLLSGCSSTTVTETTETTPSVAEQEPINYKQKWVDTKPNKLPFKAGEYTLSYKEESKLAGALTYSAEGVIGFYEDGTCAFDISGARKAPDGTIIEYRTVKFADGYPLLLEGDSKNWNSDMIYIEYNFGSNYPAMGQFPKYLNSSSWCVLGKTMELSDTEGAAPGYFLWDLEKGKEFASKSKEWYFDYVLTTLGILPADYEEARNVIELTYYGLNGILAYDGQGRIQTGESEVVSISTGVKNESDLYISITLTPSKEPLRIAIDPENTITPSYSTNAEVLTYNLTDYYTGIDYIRDVQKQFDEYANNSK